MSSSTQGSNLARGRIYLPTWLRMVLIGLTTIAVIGMMIWAMIPGPKRERPKSDGMGSLSFGQPFQARTAPPAPRAAEPAPAPEAAQAEGPAVKMPPRAAPPPRAPEPEPPASAAPPAVELAPAMYAWVREPDGAPRKPAVKQAGGKDGDDGDEDGGADATTPLGQSLATTRIHDARPKPVRYNPRFTIDEGTTFSCTPPMPIDTQIPGSIYCTVDDDVFSMDGTVRLIPKGSRAFAQIERGLGLGQDRAILNFTRVRTTLPDALIIPLNSVGASELGQNGVPGDVNEHLWQKVKLSLMFAAVEGLSSGVQSSLQRGGGNQYFGAMTSVGPNLASMAAQHDLNIPTTLYRGPGRPLKVYVNHMIDLSLFYKSVPAERAKR